jgi:hypothetical protein
MCKTNYEKYNKYTAKRWHIKNKMPTKIKKKNYKKYNVYTAK